MPTILDLYFEDVGESTVIRIQGGREYRGPCPGCGGEDRFGVWPEQNDGEGSFYCGRAKKGGGYVGKGCEKGGDIFQYLMSFRNMSFPEACRFLGREDKLKTSGGHGQRWSRYESVKPRRARTDKQDFIPEAKQHPPEVIDPALWREKGMKFVNRCHEALLNRPMSIAYLMKRGVDLDSIKLYKLGFHAGVERNGVEYEPDFRPWKSWGLRDEKNDNGRPRCLKLVAGIVVPYIVDGQLHRITIRKIKFKKKEPKYDYVVGSIRDLFLTNPGAKAFVTIETELDCIAVDAAAGDLVGTIGIGSYGVRPDVRCASFVDTSLCILGGHDFDAAGKQGSGFWERQYRQFKRWPVPDGKDPGEFVENGGDLRLWILSGLPPGLLPADILDQQIEKNTNVHPDLCELKQLLYESEGMIRRYGRGTGLARELPDGWKSDHWQKAGRISRLIYQSDAVGSFFDRQPDGLFDFEQIPGRLAN